MAGSKISWPPTDMKIQSGFFKMVLCVFMVKFYRWFWKVS